MGNRGLSIFFAVVLVFALSAPRDAQAKGLDTAPAVFLYLTLISSPIVLPALGLARWSRSDSPPSMGWGIAQALVSAPYLLASVATASVGLYALGVTGQPEFIVALGLGLLMTGVCGWLFYGGIREALDASDGSGGDAGPALRIVPTLVRDDRGAAAWGLFASASF
jgi:hypothetical protein